LGNNTKEQLISEVNILRKEIAKLKRLASRRKEAENALQQRTHDLSERIKELNCLYGLSKLVSEHDKNLEEILKETAKLIPPSWQYPDVTCARIKYGKKVFKTDNFKKTRWVQKADIIASSNKIGEIEVYYTKNMPELYEGPFLKEERHLINALAERLGKTSERKEAENALQQRTHDLSERIKELNCLYGLSKLVSEHDKNLEEILKETAKLIPPSWQYPDVTCARIKYGKKVFKTDNFKKTRWVQKADIIASSNKIGEIEVYYTKNMPELYEGPFLKEERHLINALAERLGKTSERKEAEEALQESEEKYRSLVENSIEGICISKGSHMLMVNQSFLEIFGYTNFEEFNKVPFLDHVGSEVKDAVQKRLGGGAEDISSHVQYEYEIIRKDGRSRTVEASSSEVLIGGEQYVQSTLRDITERKQVESEMKKKLMNFRINDGSLYLVKEPTPSMSIEAFKDLIRVGYNGFIVSRIPKNELETSIESSFEHLWLASKTKKYFEPFITEIEHLIENLPKRTATLVQGLEYLVHENGFEQTLSFVHKLREIAYLKSQVIILSIDPITLKNRELKLFEKEGKELEVMKKANMPDDLLEVLQFVYKQNIFGVKPSHINIQEELRVSKPTVWKRVKKLKALGYLTDVKNGRKKVLELTEKSRHLFTR